MNFPRRTPTRTELADRIDQLEHQIAHLTALVEHPTWPEPYRHQRAKQAVDRLTDSGPRPRRTER